VSLLTNEERQLAIDGLENGDPNGVLISRYGILRRQFWCLLPGQWLNDQIINFYFKLVQEHSWHVKDDPKCWCPNSFFWLFLGGKNEEQYCYERVRRWTKRAKVDIFELDYVMFPMNVGGVHWAMGTIDFKQKGFRYFDSMQNPPGRNFVPFLQRYLADEHIERRGGPLPIGSSWELIEDEPSLPRQRNSYDCGVFTCLYAEHFGAGKSLEFDRTNMTDHRLRLAARLLRASFD